MPRECSRSPAALPLVNRFCAGRLKQREWIPGAIIQSFAQDTIVRMIPADEGGVRAQRPRFSEHGRQFLPGGVGPRVGAQPQQRPGGQQVKPGTPGQPGMQQVKPGTPGQPGSQQVKPGTLGQPGSQQVKPGTPGQPGIQQVKPGTPGQPVRPGAGPVGSTVRQGAPGTVHQPGQSHPVDRAELNRKIESSCYQGGTAEGSY